MSNISRPVPQISKIIFLTALVISLALPLLPQSVANTPGPSSILPKISTIPLPLAPIASAAPYDEQVGITFTQDFSTLAFNVSAQAFTDNGIGPGYLVNGLTDRGYWDQVGLSYHWPMTNGQVNPGFSMNYEVFDPGQVSIYPTNGGGGIQAFNSTVNAGDSVLLSLSFSQGSVVMEAKDWQTRSIALQSFAAYAYNNVFIGLTSSLAQSGFFSGLMTEQYHYSPYYGTGQPVIYSTSANKLSSAWMWMDEWNTNTFNPVFETNSTSPISLTESVGHYLSSNGTAEIATSDRFVTGLTPVSFPSLFSSPQGVGQPGHSASINVGVEDQQGATVRFENLTVGTSFGRYNFTLGKPFSFGPGIGQYNLTISIPVNLKLGTYNLTIDVMSWRYLDAQAQLWIPLQPGALNETLLVTNNPLPSNPPNNPGPSTPPSGQGPSRSTRTTFSPNSFLTRLSATALPIAGGYGALVLLVVALILRQERQGARHYPALGLRFCMNCGKEIIPETIVCSHCNFPTSSVTRDPRLLPPMNGTTQSSG